MEQTPNEKKFNQIVNEYIDLFEQVNDYKPLSVTYVDKKVWIRNTESTPSTSYKVSEFEKMILTLKLRLKQRIEKISINDNSDGWMKIMNEFKSSESYKENGDTLSFPKFFDWLRTNYETPKKI